MTQANEQAVRSSFDSLSSGETTCLDVPSLFTQRLQLPTMFLAYPVISSLSDLRAVSSSRYALYPAQWMHTNFSWFLVFKGPVFSLGSLNNLLTHSHYSTNYIRLDAFACLILFPSRLWTSLEQRLWVVAMALVRKLGWTNDGGWNEWSKTWLMANLCF